jgi:hypothetical protein
VNLWVYHIHSLLKPSRSVTGSATKQIRDLVTQFQDWRQEEINKKILNWLSPLRFDDHHRKMLSKYHPSTGKSIRADQNFVKWCTASSTLSGLWMTGTSTLSQPSFHTNSQIVVGSGKSVLVSSIVNDLILSKSETTAIAFIYCDWQQLQAQTVANIIGSIVRQIAESHATLPPPLQTAYSDHGEGRFSTLTEREQLNLLKSLVAAQERCFIIIIDGLDECNHESASSTGNRMTKIEASMGHLLSEQYSVGQKRLSVFISSRFEPRLDGSSSVFQQLQLQADAQDISSFLRHELTNTASSALRTSSSLIKVFIGDPTRLDEVVRVATEQASAT